MSKVNDIRETNGQFFATVHGAARKLAVKYGVQIGSCRFWFTAENWKLFSEACK